MAEFKLGRLRFIWKGQWTTGIDYVKDDIIRYGSKSYVCLVGHTADADFYTDLNSPTPKWSLMTDGVEWKGTWTTNYLYKIGDIVSRGSNIWVCLVGHTSSANNVTGFSTDQAGGKWQALSNGVTWKNTWATTTNYVVGDVVKFGSKNYIAILEHTSDSTANSGFYTDLTAGKWQLFTDGTEWLGSWNTSTYYKINDIVKFGSKTYICLLGHTSDSTANSGFYTDLTAGKWQLFTDGVTWSNVWNTTTYYKLGDIVKFGAKDYICILGHTSNATPDSGFYTDLTASKWQLLVDGVEWRSTWSATTYYKVGDLVKYGGRVYQCNTGHTSQSLLETDQSNWDVFVNGFESVGDWSYPTHYRVNDVVKFGGDQWLCVTAHTSAATFDTVKFILFVQGLQFENNWSNSTSYQIGDIVTYGGYVYTSLTTNNVNNTPSTDLVNWALVTTGFKVQGVWSNLTAYKTGDVVTYGAYVYVALLDSTSQNPASSPTYWSLLSTGTYWIGAWTLGYTYKLGDAVSYGSNSYICVQAHTSTNPDRPDNDTLGAYWNSLAQGAAVNVTTTRGDLIYYGGAGNTRLPVGTEGQVLRSDGTDPVWAYYGIIGNVYYVALNGTDSPSYGNSIDKPWRTVKYACDSVKNGMLNPNARWLLTANKEWAVQEMYYWMLYQKANTIAPFSPASIFDQAKTIRDARYIVDALIYDITRGGNSQSVAIALSYFLPGTTNQFINAAVTSEMPYIIAAINQLKSLVLDALANTAPANNYQVLMSAPSPVSQTINLSYTTESGVTTTVNTLIGITTTALTGVTTAGIPSAIDGQSVTIFIKTGAYTEILPITVPAFTALVGDELRSTTIEPASGYETSNMFYVRNGSGIRNMTLYGLRGSFTAPNVYGTKRPTGGAYVSLDPGTGPDDTSVWITTRSPYVQNVSTFGSKCTGLMVDGTVHNGGNKSVVANDFTQVLNDGIGAWCTGTGSRMELVSVFTYYCYAGYLAEAGGKIRATNGNNSYGTFGSLSEEFDITEVPITGTVNNRTQQATITNVLTDGSEVLWLEYSNAGESYSSSPTVTVTSATGLGAVASSVATFNNAICEIRITDGGSGYITAINSAQAGNATSITLSAADIALSSAYVGMRIVLTSGKGAGQFGYIQAYNAGTKVATIYKESDNTPGWDVAVVGTPVVSILDSTTSYSIEPRITFTGGGGGSGALVRASVVSNKISSLRIIYPGSGYLSIPTMVITDPNATSAGTYTVRLSNNVLGQPTWSNRGTGYKTATATISGVGFAEFLQTGFYLTVSGMASLPAVGSSVTITGDTNFYAVVLTASSVNVPPGTYTATFQINPGLSIATAPVHGTPVTIRYQYSQVRLTGHDFLNIGTGNIANTNYPGTPLLPVDSTKQTVQYGGGRVFFTSTDQDGNFNVGNLFTVQQATGIATLNASNFNLTGIYSLQLSGAGATVSLFSTDGTFTSNSDSIIPTQKAIRTYIASQLGAGGSNLSVSSLTAGNVFISSNTITTVNDDDLVITTIAGRTVQFPNASVLNHQTGSVETHANGSTDSYQSGSTVTIDSGASLIINGTATQNNTPSNPTDVVNKRYTDRTLTLNNMWTSAW